MIEEVLRTREGDSSSGVIMIETEMVVVAATLVVVKMVVENMIVIIGMVMVIMKVMTTVLVGRIVYSCREIGELFSLLNL